MMGMHCEEAARLLSDKMERPLAWGTRLRLYWHLAMCKMCRVYGESLESLRALCLKLQDPELYRDGDRGLGPKARDRIKQALDPGSSPASQDGSST